VRREPTRWTFPHIVALIYLRLDYETLYVQYQVTLVTVWSSVIDHNFNKLYRKSKGQSRMDNSDTLAVQDPEWMDNSDTLAVQDPEWRQTNKKHNIEN
jgi:hypothetical protein